MFAYHSVTILSDDDDYPSSALKRVSYSSISPQSLFAAVHPEINTIPQRPSNAEHRCMLIRKVTLRMSERRALHKSFVCCVQTSMVHQNSAHRPPSPAIVTGDAIAVAAD